MLGSTFILFTALRNYVKSLNEKFPELIECSEYELGSKSSRFTSKEEFRKFAVIDKENALVGQGLDIYQCYCKSNSEEDIWVVVLRAK